MFCELYMVVYVYFGVFRDGEVVFGNCYSDDNSNNIIDEKERRRWKDDDYYL